MWLLFVKLLSPAPWWLDRKPQPASVLPAASGNAATGQGSQSTR